MSAILERQNRSWNASPKTLQNISRLRSGAAAAVTGQQVGLFGGPIFSIYKALTAVKLADEATCGGIDTVPIFWLATQDHDLAEINHVFLPAAQGGLDRIDVPTQGLPDSPVGRIAFGPEIDVAVESAASLLGDSPITYALKEAYRPGETFGRAFAKLFAALFAEWGVIFLDGSDPELNAVAAPIYRSAIERAAELEQALIERGKELDAAGYHQQVRVAASSTLLFWIRNGARTPIQRAKEDGQFIVGNEQIGKDKLLARIDSVPEEFSANVLLRPSVQDYLLPTLVYTGGPAEAAYFAQAGVVYEKLVGRVTPIVPRFSATIVETKPQSLLERYGLAVKDIFQSPDGLREDLARRSLPQELQSAFDQASAGLKKLLEPICEGLTRLDKTLLDSASTAAEKMNYQLEQLRARAARAELRQTEVLGRHAQLLSNALYPNKGLQERELPGIYFLSRYGEELMRDLYENIHTNCTDHQVLTI